MPHLGHPSIISQSSNLHYHIHTQGVENKLITVFTGNTRKEKHKCNHKRIIDEMEADTKTNINKETCLS